MTPKRRLKTRLKDCDKKSPILLLSLKKLKICLDYKLTLNERTLSITVTKKSDLN